MTRPRRCCSTCCVAARTTGLAGCGPRPRIRCSVCAAARPTRCARALDIDGGRRSRQSSTRAPPQPGPRRAAAADRRARPSATSCRCWPARPTSGATTPTCSTRLAASDRPAPTRARWRPRRAARPTRRAPLADAASTRRTWRRSSGCSPSPAARRRRCETQRRPAGQPSPPAPLAATVCRSASLTGRAPVRSVQRCRPRRPACHREVELMPPRLRGKWALGITPRNFTWILKDKLAICERPAATATTTVGSAARKRSSGSARTASAAWSSIIPAPAQPAQLRRARRATTATGRSPGRRPRPSG